MQTNRTLVVLGLGLALAACKINIDSEHHNGSSDPLCQALGGGGASVDSTPSTGSSLDNARAAFDGNLSSLARYEASGGSGSLILRGTAQSGVVHGPGGAGVLISRQSADQTVRVMISTYLDGVLQFTGEAGSQVGSSQSCAGSCLNRADQSYFGINTLNSFDAIEASIQLVGLPGGLDIRELCTR